MTTQTMLMTLSGRDRPGVTNQLFSGLDSGTVVRDIEQLVVRDRLVLAVLLDVQTLVVSKTVLYATALAEELGLELTIEPQMIDLPPSKRQRIHVTLLGSPLRPEAIAHVTEALAEQGGNIDRIHRIAAYPVTALLFEVSGASTAQMRRALAVAANETGADIAVQDAGLDRRGQHLVCLLYTSPSPRD